PGLHRHWQIRRSALGGPNDLPGSFRILDHGRAATLFLDPLVRAAHVDVDTVKAKILAQSGGLFHVLWRRAEKLGHDRPLFFRIYEIGHQFGLALRRGAAKSVSRDELGPEDISPALAAVGPGVPGILGDGS